MVATSARRQGNQISYEALRNHLSMNESPVLLLFGTAHGLAPEIMDKADAGLLRKPGAFYLCLSTEFP